MVGPDLCRDSVAIMNPAGICLLGLLVCYGMLAVYPFLQVSLAELPRRPPKRSGAQLRRDSIVDAMAVGRGEVHYKTPLVRSTSFRDNSQRAGVNPAVQGTF